MVRIYFHLAKINNWKFITEYFFNSIFSNGLYDYCERIKIGIVSDNFNIADYDFLNLDKIEIYNFGPVNKYEFPTLQMLYEDCLSLENFKLFYFHTKGASISEKNWNANQSILKKQYKKRNYKNFKNVENAYKYTRYWTRYFLIKKYKECLALLEHNDIVSLSQKNTNNFIPINFWWSNSSYIKTLSYPKMIQDRYDAELWICKKSEKKIKSFIKETDEYKKIKFI